MKLSPPIRPSESLPASAPMESRGMPGRATRPPARKAGWWVPRTGLHWYSLLVLLPSLLVGLYYALWAADLYQSEAQFLVRGRASSSGSAGLGSIVASIGGGGGGSMRPGMEEANAVTAFIGSLDAIGGLRQRLDLIGIWRRPESDAVSRLWYAEPEAERLQRYYRRRVTIDYDIETNISTLRAQAYRARDARDIVDALMTMSEDLVNRMTTRTQEDTLRVARGEVVIAERRVMAAREAVVAFREREQSLDPGRSAAAAIDSLSHLQGLLAQARAELQEKRAFMRPDNPQIQLLNNRIAALGAQIGVERARVTSGDETMTQQLAGYERLQLERDFAERALTSAISSLETARAETQRQQIFLLRVVEPNMAERALFPRATFNTVTVLIGLSILYGIGWLLIAGAREHAS